MMPTSSPSMDLPHKAYLLPKAISMWPPAWWTWAVLALLIVLLATVFFLLLKKHKKQRYRREALHTLNKSAQEQDDKSLITTCHELIRRCLVSENRLSLAALPSQSLIEQLDQSLPEKRQLKQLGDVFISGPYHKDIDLTSEQKEQMLNLTRYWIRKHRV